MAAKKTTSSAKKGKRASSRSMTRKAKPRKLQSVIRTLEYEVPSGTSYLDIMKDLSIVNRKLFRQGMMVGIESLEFGFVGAPGTAIVSLEVQTAGNSWSVQNAHVKGKALWNQMNDLVLEDNPSISGKWADFKVYLDGDHRDQGSLDVVGSDGVAVTAGEWFYSTYTLPQHEVDPATGLPLAAMISRAHLIGPDKTYQAGTDSFGLVQAYAQSRATVSGEEPHTPTGVQTSFFNLLTDSGSQEPELAAQILMENDNPPYDLDNYPGGATQMVAPVTQDICYVTPTLPNGIINSFAAECGLIAVRTKGYNSDGIEVTAPQLKILVKVMLGEYKGIAATPMGQ